LRAAGLGARSFPSRSFPEDLLHGPALRELVDELVEAADEALGPVLELLDAVAADEARDLRVIGIDLRSPADEGLEVAPAPELPLQGRLVVAGQSGDDLVDLFPLPPLALGLLDIEGIDLAEDHAVDLLGGGGLLRGISHGLLLFKVREPP